MNNSQQILANLSKVKMMKIKGIAFLLLIYLSAGPALSRAQNLENSDALHSIISFILESDTSTRPVTEVIVPEGADTDFSDSSDWDISATPSRDIANAIDGDPNTRWATRARQTAGQFFEINFNTKKTFNNIVLDSNGSPDDYPRGYNVLVSQDGSNWTNILSDFAFLESEVEIVLPVQTAQYLRIEQTGSARNWWAIHEIIISLDDQLPEIPGSHVPAVTSNTVVDANRFLNQATFGATEEDVQALIGLDNDSQSAYEQWIDQQISAPATANYLSTTVGRYPEFNYVRNIDSFVDQWFINTIEAPDQLRQRVAWALSQIFVVSSQGGLLFRRPFGVADYYDLLVRNSFGNYRDLLEQITLHPAMGQYLSMAGNRKANDSGTISPDENFAREVMQLFSIGLVQLNLDGSPVLDSSGNLIDTYNTETIQGFARVFTGWNYQCEQDNPNCTFSRVRIEEEPPQPGFNQISPMVLYADEHETGTKTVLDYPGAQVTTIPAGQTGEQDLEMALDNIFNHPNVGPFIAKQLIQRMTASNPSPSYIERVATVFNNDGSGTRGNLGAVVRAVLLDNEARSSVTSNNIRTAGKMKEPIMRIIHLWRSFDAFAGNGRIDASRNFSGGRFSPSDLLAQGPLQAPSVFNFYSPFYAPAGDIADQGLVAPELQLANEFLNTTLTNYFYLQVNSQTNADNVREDQGRVYINTSEETVLAADRSADEVIDSIAIKLFGGADQISSTLRRLVREQLDLTLPNSTENIETRTKQAIFFIVTSPEFAWQQ